MFSTKRIRLAAAAVAVAVAATGIGVGLSASASASTHRSAPAHAPAKPKVSLDKLNLTGFEVDAKYTLGTNTGNTFQQTYMSAGSVQGVPVAGPDVGISFPVEDYVALRISPTQVYITWQDPSTFAIVDVFVMNLATHTVYDYAPGTATPQSAGTITVLKWGSLHP